MKFTEIPTNNFTALKLSGFKTTNKISYQIYFKLAYKSPNIISGFSFYSIVF